MYLPIQVLKNSVTLILNIYSNEFGPFVLHINELFLFKFSSQLNALFK